MNADIALGFVLGLTFGLVLKLLRIGIRALTTRAEENAWEHYWWYER